MEHVKQLEALLFVSGEPLSAKEIMNVLGIGREALDEAANMLENALKDRGIQLLRHKEEFTLTTAAATTSIVEKFAKERLEGDLSKAALETLAVIVWKGKASRSTIDYVRGVNSSNSIRTLLIRGLIERVQDEKDARVYTYSPTIDLFKYFGISSTKELPSYEELSKELENHD